MSSPLQRLYQTKLALLSTISTVLGIALLLLAHWVEHTAGGAWLANFPVTDVGSALFTTGLLAIFFQYVGNEDAEQQDLERTRTVLAEEAPAFRDAVIQGFAFNADDLARVANPAVLDQIAVNVLALQLGDRGLAEDAYADLRNQVIQAPERWRDVSISVALTPCTAGPAGADAMFIATLRWEYRTIPATPTVRFSCVADKADYREALRDPTIASAWYFGTPAGVTAAAREAYELTEFTVDGRARPISRTHRADSQTYVATIPEDVAPGQEVTITCTYRVLVKQHGHLLYLDLPRPAKGLHVALSYGGCGIRTVNTLDFIAGSQQARISQTPDSEPTPSVALGFDGWVFPRSGVAFVWALRDEAGVRPRPQAKRSTSADMAE